MPTKITFKSPLKRFLLSLNLHSGNTLTNLPLSTTKAVNCNLDYLPTTNACPNTCLENSESSTCQLNHKVS